MWFCPCILVAHMQFFCSFVLRWLVLPWEAGLGVVGEGSLSQVKAVPADTLDDHIRNSPPSNFLLKTQLFLSALLQLNTVLRVAQNSFNTQKKDNKLTLRY